MDPSTRVKVGDVQTFRSLLDRLRALPAARADALVAAVLLAEALFEILTFAPLEGTTLALVASARRRPVMPLPERTETEAWTSEPLSVAARS